MSFKKKKWLYHVVGKKKKALGFKGEKNVTLCLGRKVRWGGVIEGTSWMTNWGGYEMRLDLIRTLESTLPYSMYQMGSLSGAFPLIIPFQCYAPTPCWRNLTGGWAWGVAKETERSKWRSS